MTRGTGAAGRLLLATRNAGKLVELAPIRDLFENPLHPYTQLLISSLPTLEQRGVFQGVPGLPPSLLNPPPGCLFAPRCPHAMDVCRVNTPDPVVAWQAHIAGLLARSRSLNDRRFAALHFRGPGTDLTVGLPEGHLWNSAQAVSTSGITFTPNIPTEEVFTLPHRERVDGVVAATLPLSYAGTLIEGIRLVFKQGKVVDICASRGEAVLRQVLAADEGATRLGEVALVPQSSPIARQGRARRRPSSGA